VPQISFSLQAISTTNKVNSDIITLYSNLYNKTRNYFSMKHILEFINSYTCDEYFCSFFSPEVIKDIMSGIGLSLGLCSQSSFVCILLLANPENL